MQTTADLVAAARQSPEAFAVLVQRFQGMAIAYALGRLDDPTLALEASQDAFLEAWTKLDQLRDDAAFAGWLRRIVHTRCQREVRRQRPVPTTSTELPDPGAPTDEVLASAEREAWLEAAVDQLPEGHRRVVALHYLAGLSVGAVAEFLELPLTTVKKRLFDARRKLRAAPATAVPESLDLPDRIRLFVELRRDDVEAVTTLIRARPTLLEARESWTDEVALESGLHLAHGLGPLVLASSRGNAAMVRALLALGADPNGTCGCDAGETALYAARRVGATEVVALLLEAGAHPEGGPTPRSSIEPRGAPRPRHRRPRPLGPPPPP